MIDTLKKMNRATRTTVNDALANGSVRGALFTMGALAVLGVITTASAMAQQAAGGNPVDYGILCRGVQMLAAQPVRMGAIAIGGGSALFGMWRHEQNPFQWAKEHPGTFVACAAFASIPTLMPWLFGSTCQIN